MMDKQAHPLNSDYYYYHYYIILFSAYIHIIS
jgi:hypothetical protein